MSWLEGIWTMHWKNSRTRAESWEWVIFRNDGLRRKEMEKTHEMLRMGLKNSHNQKQLWGDGVKLELHIFGRTGKDLRGTLLRSSKFKNDDKKHHHELLRHCGRIKRKRLSQRWKEFENNLGEGMWMMEFILTSSSKRIRNGSGIIRRVR